MIMNLSVEGIYAQVLDEEHAEEVHQKGADAKAQEEQEGNRVSTETPVQFALLRLERLLFHDDRKRAGSRQEVSSENSPMHMR